MSDFGPIYTGRPRALTQYENKYNNPSSTISGFSNPTLMAMQHLDAARANLGQSPLTQKESAVAGQAAEAHASAPELKTDQPWWKDALSDITSITGEIPKLPFTLGHELTQLPTLPERAQELPASSNPLEAIGNIAKLPGIRVLPGSFTASQFAPGGQGIGGLTEHPVYTALDLLPYAEKGLSLTPTYKAAEEAAARAAAEQGTLPARVTPFSANLKSFPNTEITMQPSPVTPGLDVSTLERNPLGAFGQAATERLGTTSVGKFADEAFSRMEREQARSQQRIAANSRMTTAETPLPGYESPLAKAAATTRDFAPEVEAAIRDMGPERAAEVQRIGQIGNPDELATLSPKEQAFVQNYNVMQDPLSRAAVDAGQLGEATIAGNTDYYAKKFTDRLDKARTDLAQRQAVQYLRDDLNPRSLNSADEAALADHFQTAMADDTIKAGARKRLARGYLQAFENRGYDVRPARAAVDTLKKEELATLPDMVPDSPTNAVLTRTNGSSTHYNGLKTWTRDGRQFTPGQMNQVAAKVDAIEAGAVPSKFEPAVRQEFEKRLSTAAEQKFAAEPAKLEQFQQYMDNGYAYPELKRMMPEEYAAIKSDAGSMVQEMRAQGYDPTFVHEVHPARASEYDYAKITSNIPDLKQFKSRMFNPQPTEPSWSVALNHRSMEILLREGRKYYVENDLMPRMSRTEEYLRDTYMPAAQATGQPVDELIKKDWTRFSPGDYIDTGKFAAPSPETANTIYIPRATARNLERLSATPSDLARGGEHALKPFRTLVINLSPRLHLYNTIGGAIMTSARAENPLLVFKNIRQAWGMAKEEGLSKLAMDPSLTDAERAAALQMPGGQAEQIKFMTNDDPAFHNLANDIKSSSTEAANQKSWATLAGSQMEHYLKQAWDAGATKTLRQGFNWTTAKSLWLNETVDNMYRGLNYLESYDNAIKKGLSGEEAITKGVQSVRETLQNFDTMTPLERTTMRYLVPFWSWARTALRYAMTYPADHPWRMSILSGLARAEAEDFNTGLPGYMKSWLFLGDTKQDGTVKAINLDGINPFRDVSNYFTLGGFLATGEGGGAGITAQINPLIATALQQFGVDTMSGESEMFPQTQYNPTTGRLEALPKEGTISNLFGNLIPQGRALLAVTGQSNTFKELMRRDPSAAGRSLWSAAGMPSLARNVDVPTETMKAELTRYNAYKADVKNMLQSGNVGDITSKYPGLTAFKDRLSALAPAAAAKYNPAPGMAGSYNPGYGDLFKQALAAGGVPVG